MAKDSLSDKNARSPFDSAPTNAVQTGRRKLDDYHPPKVDDRKVNIEGGPEHDFPEGDHSLFRPRPLRGGLED